MAGDRNFFKRSFEILGGTAVEIGKDYTSNLQSLVSDAGNIKNTVIQGAVDAKSQFQNMRKSGNGPIKSLIDWFYNKENEYDPFSLDDYDSDFDPGTSFGEPNKDEDSGPASLDVKGAERVAKGHISSMFKIASKIAETQVANTAEIITTINSRTAEMVAAANNINTTLIGISKKLDSVTTYINARSLQESKRGQYDSLVDSDGRFTLGATWDAAKRNMENGGLGTAKSILSMLGSSGGLTPESVLRLAFDFTVGDKKFNSLGGQSINQLGKNFNDAIAQSISDGLSALMDSKGFQKLFGNLKQETRSNDFRTYTKNEYTRDPAIFDGMTRTSIIKTIPDYLKKIYESISGKTLNVGSRGELTEKEGMTFASIVSGAAFKRSAVNSDMLHGYLKSGFGLGSGLDQYDANTIGKMLTGAYIMMMLRYDIRVIDKKFINPYDEGVVTTIATYYASENNIRTSKGDLDIGRAYSLIQSMLQYINSDRGILNKVVGEINYAYEKARTEIEQKAQYAIDQEHVGYVTKALSNNALGSFIRQRKRSDSKPQQTEQNESLNDVQQFLGSGDPLKIYGGASDAVAVRTTTDTLNDIRELLTVTTKHMIGAKKFKSISPKLSKPSIMAASVTVSEIDPNDPVEREKIDTKVLSNRDSLRQAGSDIHSNFFNALSGPNGGSNLLTEKFEGFVSGGKDLVSKFSDKVSDMVSGLGVSKEDEEDKNTVTMISGFMQTAIESGSASPDEKNTIQRLVDSLHNQQLRQKMSKSINAMLDRASFKSESGEDGKGKKSIFGKLLSVVGLIVSPVKLMSKAITFILPKLFTGLKRYVKLFNFGKDFRNIKTGLSGVGSGIKELRSLRREQKDLKRQAAYEERVSQVGSLGSTVGADGTVSSDFSMYGAPAGLGGQFEADYSNYFGNDPKKAIKRAGKIKGAADTRDIEDAIRRDEAAERESRRELREAKRALKEAEKTAKREQKQSQNAEQKDGFWSGFKGGFGETFKGLGSLEDFKKSFKEAAGISTGSKVKVEGVEGHAESFTERILAKFIDFFTGKEDSVFKKIEENTDEDKSDGVDNSGGVSTEDQQPQTENKDEQPGVGQAGNIVGSAVNAITKSGASSAASAAGGAAAEAAGGAVAEGATGALGAAAEGAGGALAGAGGAAAAAGTAAKAVSMIGKIGATVGKIAGSLGTIGIAVAKIVIKATMMLSGFKALMKTIGSITTELTKVVKIGLEPLNKIFHALNKILKPIIKTLSGFLKKVVGILTTVVSAIIDTIVPILNGVIQPIMNALEPVLDIIINTLEPIYEVLSSVVEIVFIPFGGIFKYLLTPLIKQIANTIQVISGLIEVGVGAIMKGLGNLLAGVGVIAKVFGASGLYDAGKKMAQSGDDMVNQGVSDVKNGFTNLVTTAIKGLLLIDQTEDYDNTHIKNPNAPEVNSIGSVMDGYASGDYNGIYGSGNKAQRAYGSTLDISNNGCGPLALADAASRRSGSSVDGLAMASKMASYGTYEPGRGTSVGSFMNTANAMGMGLRPGEVTQSSLKSASPNNPITVVGSGADFGTRKGNNHYMNVIGTDKYGGAYVSNPLTGRVDRKSASSIAGSSVLGLYGGGDSSDYYTFPEVVSEALAELKNLTASILGMFTGQSTSDSMNEQMNDYNAQSQLDTIKESINNAQNDQYDGKTYEEIEAAAREKALAAFEEKYPRKAGETEDEYNARFEKWYTPTVQLKYMSEESAYDAAKNALDHRAGSISNAFDSMSQGLMDAETQMDTAYQNAKEYGSSSSSGGSGSGYFTADNGVSLWVEPYKDNIEITDTNITGADDYHSPLFEFFAKTMGGQIGDVRSAGWFNKYNDPNREGVGQSGKEHGGVDFYRQGGSLGKPLYATTGGTVVKVQNASSGEAEGNSIMWQDAGGMYHWYMHMKNPPKKKVGDMVDPGEVLGYIGNTGECYGDFENGAHLHYTIRDNDGGWSNDSHSINPLMYFKNYNPTGVLSGSTNDQKIWAYLRDHGATKEATAGFMGNWQVESSNNPQHIEGYYYWPQGDDDEVVAKALTSGPNMTDYTLNKLFPMYQRDGVGYVKKWYNEYPDTESGDYYAGFGLAQWTGPRTVSLIKDAKASGRDLKDLSLQLDKWKDDVTGAYSGTLTRANASDSPESAALEVLNTYDPTPQTVDALMKLDLASGVDVKIKL